MNRQLDVFIDEKPVGQLFENTGVWSFRYARTGSAPGTNSLPEFR